MFFTRRVKDDMGYPQEDFYVSEFDSVNGWSSASPLVFNTRMNEGAMSVSSNGVLYVYTACDRSNSYGGCDLYIREYNVQTGWSKEYNLGNDINTRHWESQPCFLLIMIIYILSVIDQVVLEKVIFGEQKLLEINF